MLVAAAFCPSPPLLHPSVGTGIADEIEPLRAAAVAAVAALADGLDSVVTVGVAPRTGWYPANARGSLAPLGIDLVLGRGTGPVELPGPLALAAWLLDLAGYDGEVNPFGVADDEDPRRLASLGAGVADRKPRVGMLVMGDGSARRSEKAPGSLDPRAEQFDEDVVAALTAVDGPAITAIDATLAQELMVNGRVPWQLAAAALAARPVMPDVSIRGARHYKDAPYGVGYAVVGWNERG